MTIARFKDLCLDAADPERLGTFWARALHRAWIPMDDGDGRIEGATPQQTIWVNRVPEPKTVKHRTHLDVYTHTLAELEALGATLKVPEGDDRHWTVMADPEGGEFCAFRRRQIQGERLHGIVVDCADPAALAPWWHEMLGGELTVHDAGWATVGGIPGLADVTYDFVPVPEAKAAKNRVHLDVVADPAELVRHGATPLRSAGTLGWDVLADPEGNEFCAFPPS